MAMMKLRALGLRTRYIGFFLITKDFQTHEMNQKLHAPVDEDGSAIDIFKELFKKCFRENFIYRKAGINLSLFSTAGDVQYSLFDISKKTPLSPITDQIYGKYGPMGINRGSLIKFNPNQGF